MTTAKPAAIGSGFYLFLWRLSEVGCIKKNSQKSSHLWFSIKNKSFKSYFCKPPKNCFLDCQFYVKLKNDLFLVILKSTHYAAEVSIILKSQWTKEAIPLKSILLLKLFTSLWKCTLIPPLHFEAHIFSGRSLQLPFLEDNWHSRYQSNLPHTRTSQLSDLGTITSELLHVF